MIAATPPDTERERLAALVGCRVLDTPAEQDFDDLTALAATIAGTPIALVSFVDGSRQWFKSRHGLAVDCTPREQAFCAHAILGTEPFVVRDALLDERFHDNPLVTGEPHVRSYVGAPLIDHEGHALGTLCVIDHVPRDHPPATLQALRQLARQVVAQIDLRRTRVEAEKATAVKAEFLSNMSHEIRTPLNGVLGSARLLLESGLAPQQRELAAIIRDCGEHLLAVVSDILDLSRLEDGRIRLEPAAFDVQELLRHTLAIFHGPAATKGLDLRLEWRANAAVQRLGDPTRVRQVLMNLFGNAVKFTTSGGVTITVSDALVPVVGASGAPAAACAGLRFEVEDTGPGIAPERLDSLFAPFTQADGSTTRRYGGTGLGLAIAQRLATLMGGALVVDSELGRGSTFTFTLPLPPTEPTVSRVGARATGTSDAARERSDRQALPIASSSDADGPDPAAHAAGASAGAAATGAGKPAAGSAQGGAHAAPASAAAAANVAACTGMRVLLADDNPVNRLLATRLLTRLGCVVTTADNGVAAVAAWRTQPFDVILMDCHMPEMDGFDATARIRGSGTPAACIPILALTASSVAEDRDRGLGVGMNDFLTKPIGLDRLATAMLQALGRC